MGGNNIPMSISLDYSQLRPGDIFHVRSFGFWANAIREMLGSWGNHDGLLLNLDHWQDKTARCDPENWYVGDSRPLRAKPTPLWQYERMIKLGQCEAKIYRPKKMLNCDEPGRAAQAYWMTFVNKSFYDFMAYPRLFLKCVFGDIFQAGAGWEWAHWCTEGVANSLKFGGKVDPYRKSNPTPYTTEKRVMSEELIDISSTVFLKG